MSSRAGAVLFDLDGTLIDSAPDLAGAANDMLRDRGLPLAPYERLRAMVGSGARGLVGAAFGVGPADPGFDALRDEFLARYEARMTLETRVFAEVELLLGELEARSLPWGIVTNKSIRLADPISRALGLFERAAVVIGGDSTPHAKPHPEPLLEAARRMKVEPCTCFYVGDDLRDVQAGQAAGMRTIAVKWGYLGEAGPIDAWESHHIAERPQDLMRWVAPD